MLIWYRHARPRILLFLHFCIRFCIFLHRACFWRTSSGPGRSGYLLYTVAPTHSIQVSESVSQC